jgi:hypothetical protein
MWSRIILALGISAGLLLGGRRGAGANSIALTPRTQPSAVEEALAAAMRIFDGISGPDCVTPNPQGKACITLQSSAETVTHGIAHVGVAGADGVGGTNAILGRDRADEWRVWFTTQNFYYQLLVLPGEMIVCADGDDLNVRAAPARDAAVVGTMPHRTRVTAEEFVLTEERTIAADRQSSQPGAGWYRLSAPVQGWAYSRLLSNTTVDANERESECWARNLREGS